MYGIYINRLLKLIVKMAERKKGIQVTKHKAVRRNKQESYTRQNIFIKRLTG